MYTPSANNSKIEIEDFTRFLRFPRSTWYKVATRLYEGSCIPSKVCLVKIIIILFTILLTCRHYI